MFISRIMHRAAGVVLLLCMTASVYAGQLSGPYVNPDYLTKVYFGAHSHWVQPWRAYMETVPAARFVDAVGINFDVQIDQGDNPELIAQMLAKNGIRHARIEIGWGNLSFQDETIQTDAPRKYIQACRKFGIRPLLLLNSHHGVPCPMQYFNRTLASPAKQGDMSVQLTSTEGLKPGYSGFCDLTDYWACEAFVTGIEGNTVHLSKPLPKNLGDTGKDVLMATLKYRPFSPSDTEDYRKTMEGWRKYVETATRYVTDALGTTGSVDKGFDIEIWNELSFGCNFLNINQYYEPDIYAYNTESVWPEIVKSTVDYVNAHPDDFRGVTICDGFSNTVPWPASSTEPDRVSALSHHPYAGVKTYPESEYKGDALDALMQVDKSGFIPAYTQIFPEYFGTALQTETSIRDMAPITTDIYSTKHGRFARESGGKVNPCPMWITEVGIAPNEIGITDRETALKLKAKTTARYLCFYVNKGTDRIYMFSACSGDEWLGLVKDDFVKYSRTSSDYPKDDRQYTSPALTVISRIVAKMKERMDPKLKQTRQLRINSISDTHDHIQFKGDGTPAHPDLYNRDVLAILPYQVNRNRFVIPYYVMTRDVRTDLKLKKYTVAISCIDGRKASVSVYDPINNRVIPFKVESRGADTLSLTLTAVDYPYLLTIDEKASK